MILSVNLRTYESGQGSFGLLRANGPGEIWEIDATGGRLELVAEGDPDVVLGHPYIYLIIDRWSCSIPAIYLTLRPPSWDELSYALIIAFTSRERRFKSARGRYR